MNDSNSHATTYKETGRRSRDRRQRDAGRRSLALVRLETERREETERNGTEGYRGRWILEKVYDYHKLGA